MSLDYIRKNIVVCNGGDTTSNAIKNISAIKNVHYLQIRDGDLWVADTANASIGLRFILPGESLPVFIHLPRDKSLGIMNNDRRICKAMRWIIFLDGPLLDSTKDYGKCNILF